MKQGNQFYLDFQISDENCEILNNDDVEKIVFHIGKDLSKTYSEGSEEVEYDEENMSYKVWLSEAETLEFEGLVDLEARILFKNGTIMGSYISREYFNPILVKESILEEGD